MIIMESAIAMNNDYVECTNTLGRISLFAEAAYKEYEINLKEVALKVLQENGTEDDFNFLATEAATGYIERAKKAIMKIVEAVKKFIRTCKDRLIAMVTNAKTEAAVDKVDELCKANPKFRSMKVEYQNTDKQVGIIQQGIDRIRKNVAKVKAKGKATDKDIEDVQEIESDIMKKASAVAVVSLASLGTAVAIFKECNSRSEIDSALDENALSDCDISIDSDTTQDAVTADYYIKASGAIAKLKKEKTTKKVVKATSLLTAIKSAVSKLKGKVKSENLEEQTHESVSLEDLTMFAITVESTESVDDEQSDEDETVATESVGIVEGLDMDSYFTELCDELFTNVTESTEETEECDVVEESAEGESVEETPTTEEVVEEYSEEVTEEPAKDDVVEESSNEEVDNTLDLVTYMEQLEHDVFGENEEVVEESSEEETETTTEPVENVTTESTEISIESLLDEMEALL